MLDSLTVRKLFDGRPILLLSHSLRCGKLRLHDTQGRVDRVRLTGACYFSNRRRT